MVVDDEEAPALLTASAARREYERQRAQREPTNRFVSSWAPRQPEPPGTNLPCNLNATCELAAFRRGVHGQDHHEMRAPEPFGRVLHVRACRRARPRPRRRSPARARYLRRGRACRWRPARNGRTRARRRPHRGRRPSSMTSMRASRPGRGHPDLHRRCRPACARARSSAGSRRPAGCRSRHPRAERVSEQPARSADPARRPGESFTASAAMAERSRSASCSGRRSSRRASARRSSTRTPMRAASCPIRSSARCCAVVIGQRAGLEQLGVPADRRQRCAQLVGGIGDERAQRLLRRLARIERRVQRPAESRDLVATRDVDPPLDLTGGDRIGGIGDVHERAEPDPHEPQCRYARQAPSARRSRCPRSSTAVAASPRRRSAATRRRRRSVLPGERLARGPAIVPRSSSR